MNERAESTNPEVVAALERFGQDPEWESFGPSGLVVLLRMIGTPADPEDPLSDAAKDEEVALIDSITALQKNLNAGQRDQLESILIGFFRLGATLLLHQNGKQADRRPAPSDAARARAVELATDLWESDTEHEFRLIDMAEQINEILAREGFSKVLPKIDRIKGWLRPHAPDYASLPGRRSK